jgi:hypothetical protein
MYSTKGMHFVDRGEVAKKTTFRVHVGYFLVSSWLSNLSRRRRRRRSYPESRTSKTESNKLCLHDCSLVHAIQYVRCREIAPLEDVGCEASEPLERIVMRRHGWTKKKACLYGRPSRFQQQAPSSL